MTKTYPAVAKLISEHSYVSKDSGKLSKVSRDVEHLILTHKYN